MWVEDFVASCGRVGRYCCGGGNAIMCDMATTQGSPGKLVITVTVDPINDDLSDILDQVRSSRQQDELPRATINQSAADELWADLTHMLRHLANRVAERNTALQQAGYKPASSPEYMYGVGAYEACEKIRTHVAEMIVHSQSQNQES